MWSRWRSGPAGSFYRLSEEAERRLDFSLEVLTAQGALYTQRLLVRQAGFQAKELRRLAELANAMQSMGLALEQESVFLEGVP